MSNIFVISDTHFGHKRVIRFREGEKPMRPFVDLEDMHRTLIENWNSVVTKRDVIYHLGDVAFNGAVYDEIMPQLNGMKYLVRGNHDTFGEERYRKHFQKILGCHVLDHFALTHVPIHASQGSRWKGNIHGHMHNRSLDDPFYFNASVEAINYKPIAFEEIKKIQGF